MHGRLSPLLTFIVLVAALSSAPYVLIVHAHSLSVGSGLIVGLLMWMPALAAFATCLLLGIDLADLGWRWPSRPNALAYLLPLFYALPVYVACWLAVPHSSGVSDFVAAAARSYGFPQMPNTSAVLALATLATIGVVRTLASALGEEIGWRGFLLPRLVQRFGFAGGCLMSGCIWAVWHYPALLLADYNSGTPKLYALACFTAMVIAMAFVMGWFRLQSGSLWPCAILHASHNLFVQAVFDPMTRPVGRALYITTEFGFGLAITVAVTAVLLVVRWPVRYASDAVQPQAVPAR